MFLRVVAPALVRGAGARVRVWGGDGIQVEGRIIGGGGIGIDVGRGGDRGWRSGGTRDWEV